jgi:excinuclease ABC subunit C
VRGQYRRYNIEGVAPGDDYAAMRQALERRFRRAAEAAAEAADPDSGTVPGASAAEAGEGEATAAAQRLAQAVLPDLLLIDGGAGQIAQANAVLADLGLTGICVVGVAKGEARRPGDETLLLPDGRELHPGAASSGLQLIQQVRDEAHRFAITGHRGRRQKARVSSRLEDIPGIGPRRRANLLRHFGGLAGLRAAGVEEIARVEGVNAALAGRIYAALHGLADG